MLQDLADTCLRAPRQKSDMMVQRSCRNSLGQQALICPQAPTKQTATHPDTPQSSSIMWASVWHRPLWVTFGEPESKGQGGSSCSSVLNRRAGLLGAAALMQQSQTLTMMSISSGLKEEGTSRCRSVHCTCNLDHFSSHLETLHSPQGGRHVSPLLALVALLQRSLADELVGDLSGVASGVASHLPAVCHDHASGSCCRCTGGCQLPVKVMSCRWCASMRGSSCYHLYAHLNKLRACASSSCEAGISGQRSRARHKKRTSSKETDRCLPWAFATTQQRRPMEAERGRALCFESALVNCLVSCWSCAMVPVLLRCCMRRNSEPDQNGRFSARPGV